MAYKQIPNLPVAVSLSGAEEVEIVQAGVSVRTTTQDIADLAIVYVAQNVTTSQKNALAAVAGQIVFDTNLAKLCVYNGASWETITSS